MYAGEVGEIFLTRSVPGSVFCIQDATLMPSYTGLKILMTCTSSDVLIHLVLY